MVSIRLRIKASLRDAARVTVSDELRVMAGLAAGRNELAISDPWVAERLNELACVTAATR
jgi:hypothetical protein